MHRPSGRASHQLRPIRITRHYTKHAEGSVLVAFGDTQVLCNVSVTEGCRVFKGHRAGLVNRGIRHVAALYGQPHGSGGGQG